MTGTQLRDAAIGQLEMAWGDWIDDAVEVIRDLSKRPEPFTSDDVWKRVDAAAEPRAMGAAFTRAKKMRLVVPLTEWRLSVRPECHRRPVRVWIGSRHSLAGLSLLSPACSPVVAEGSDLRPAAGASSSPHIKPAEAGDRPERQPVVGNCEPGLAGETEPSPALGATWCRDCAGKGSIPVAPWDVRECGACDGTGEVAL